MPNEGHASFCLKLVKKDIDLALEKCEIQQEEQSCKKLITTRWVVSNNGWRRHSTAPLGV